MSSFAAQRKQTIDLGQIHPIVCNVVPPLSQLSVRRGQLDAQCRQLLCGAASRRLPAVPREFAVVPWKRRPTRTFRTPSLLHAIRSALEFPSVQTVEIWRANVIQSCDLRHSSKRNGPKRGEPGPDLHDEPATVFRRTSQASALQRTTICKPTR
jgi:hypothetical protein